MLNGPQFIGGTNIDPSAEPIRQACAVPICRTGEQLQVCLITSLKKRRWILPKGIIDPGETCNETALKEALEEAGLHGRIVGEPLGVYEDFKWGRPLLVSVLMMAVTHCEDEWYESDVRDRCWVSPDRAVQMISKPALRRFVKLAAERVLAD